MAPLGRKNNNRVSLFLNLYFNAFLALALIIFLAISYFVVLKPKFDVTLTAIQISIADQQKIYAQEEAKLAGLRSMAELYKKIDSGDLSKFNKLLPDFYAPEQLFGELEEIISKQGLIVGSISLNPPVETGSAALPASVGRLSISLSLGAIDYRGLKNLLNTLETNLRLLDVTKVSFSPEGSAATLEIDTYYYKK